MDIHRTSDDRQGRRLNPNLDGHKYAPSDMNRNNIYKTGHLDYTVPEFYDIFKSKLPCLVIVDQGFHGDITEDTFDREQVILLKTVSTQRRVIGNMVTSDRQTTWISLPIDYKEKVCLVKRDRVCNATALSEILKEYYLPCHIRFPDHTTVQVGTSNTHAQFMPTIELTEEFDEMFFLGNFVNYGELAMNIVPVPLYLKDLRFKLITGIIDKPKQEFLAFMEKLKLASRFLNFNIKCGNPNIAEYDRSAIHTGAQFTFIQPSIYTDFMTITRRQPSAPPREQVETIAAALREQKLNRPLRTDENGRVNTSRNPRTQDIRKRPLPPLPHEIASDRTASRNEMSKQQHEKTFRPPLPHKQGQPRNQNIHITHQQLEQARSKKLDRPSSGDHPSGFSLLAETVFVHNTPTTSFPAAKNKRPVPLPRSPTEPEVVRSIHPPEAEVERSVPPPEPEPDYGTTWDVQNARPSHSSPAHVKRTTEKQEHSDNIPKYRTDGGKTPVNVRELTIVGVGEYLVKLNLYKYRPLFRDNMIDGELLIELDTDLMATNFGMNKIEALRLMKFAKTGLIPT